MPKSERTNLNDADQLKTLVANERHDYLQLLLLYLDAAADALKFSGSEAPQGINPSQRDLCRLFAAALPQLRAEYQLLQWQDQGPLNSRFGASLPLVVHQDAGLPLRPESNTVAPPAQSLAALAAEAQARLLQTSPTETASPTEQADHFHLAAMRDQFHRRRAHIPEVPAESLDARQFDLQVIRRGTRRELQDLTACRYDTTAARYVVHSLRAWRSPTASAPIFASHDDHIAACAWYSDNHTEAVHYAKLAVGPFHTPWSTAPADNPALANLIKNVPTAVILRLQISSEDRDGDVGEWEVWLTNSDAYAAAIDSVGTIFEVYEV